MDQSEKLLIGIENIFSLASDLIDEVARLKNVEEECQILKEKLFLNQFTKAEQEIYFLAIDGHSIAEIQEILFKEESTIKEQGQSILQKLNASSMTEAVQQFKNINKKTPEKLICIS